MKKIALGGFLFIFIFILCANARPAEDISGVRSFYAGEEIQILRMTLDDALKIAIINNFDIQLARYDRAIKDTDVDDALSIYDTVVKLEAEYTHDELEKSSVFAGKVAEDYEAGLNLSKKLITGTDVDIDYRFLRNRTDSSYTTINPSEESYLKFAFTQPLMKNILGMNDWGDVKITRIDVNNFRSETLDKIEKSLSEVEIAYWKLLLLDQITLIREDAEKKAKAFYDIVEDKEKIGSSELTDLYAAKANLKVRRAELILNGSNLTTAQNNLKLLVNNNEAGSSLRILPIDAIDIPAEGISLVPALKTAFDNRRDYKRAMNTIKAKDIKLAMKKNERWPQLDLEGSFKINGVRRSLAASITDTLEDANAEYYAGFTFSFPLEGREAKSAFDKAKFEKAKALVELKKVEKTIVTEIDSKVKAVNSHRQRVNEFSEMVEFQKYKLQEETKKYRYGRSDSDRITRFQQDYLDAEISLRLAMLDYLEALTALYLDQNIYLAERDLVVR